MLQTVSWIQKFQSNGLLLFFVSSLSPFAVLFHYHNHDNLRNTSSMYILNLQNIRVTGMSTEIVPEEEKHMKVVLNFEILCIRCRL